MSPEIEPRFQSVLDHLREQRVVWVRIAAARIDDGWRVLFLEMVSGAAPPSWRALQWHYKDACFVATRRSGAVVARWLVARRVRLGTLDLEVPTLGAGPQERQPSHRSGQFEPLPWPSTEWRLNLSGPGVGAHFGNLIGDTAPSFVTFQTAAATLLGMRIPFGGSFDSRYALRNQDLRCRISRVRIEPTRISISVEGRLAGLTIELAGDVPGPTRHLRSGSSRTTTFDLPNGLPAGAWVLVREHDEWLDRRYLTPPFATSDDADVENVIEPATEVELLVAEGEGPRTEFKEAVPEDTMRVAKTVAAFANGTGGHIVVGVNDDLEIVGLDRKNGGSRARDRVAQMIESWVFPLAPYAVSSVRVAEDRWVLVIAVGEGPLKPYGAGTDAKKLVYYVRRSANTIPVGPELVGVIARSQLPPPPPLGGIFG